MLTRYALKLSEAGRKAIPHDYGEWVGKSTEAEERKRAEGDAKGKMTNDENRMTKECPNELMPKAIPTCSALGFHHSFGRLSKE